MYPIDTDEWDDDEDDEEEEDDVALAGTYTQDEVEDMDPPYGGGLRAEIETLRLLLEHATRVEVMAVPVFGMFTPGGNLQAISAHFYDPMSPTGKSVKIFTNPKRFDYTDEDLMWTAEQAEDPDAALMALTFIRDEWLERAAAVRRNLIQMLEEL